MSAHPPMPFTISHQLHTVRLLEVPDDLLETITSRGAVRLVSQPANDGRSDVDASGSGSTKQGFLHVCTDDKVWTVRQMSTSNSVYIARTTNSASSSLSAVLDHEENTEGRDLAPREGGHALTAFAKPTSILELQEMSNDGLEVAAGYLRRLVAVWPASLTDSTTSITSNTVAPTTPHAYTTTTSLLDDIPCSATAVRTAISLAPLFTVPSGELRIPSQAFLLETWTKIIEISTLLDLPFTHDLLGHEGFRACLETDMGGTGVGLARRILDSRDGLLRALGLMVDECSGSSSGKNSDQSNDSENHNSPATIRYNECGIARWTGRLMSQVQLESTSAPKINTSLLASEQKRKARMSVAQFMQTWHSTLPASWMRHADLSLLKDIIGTQMNNDNEAGEEVVVFLDTEKPASIAMPQQQQQQSKAISKTSGTTSKGKRKWHERFAAQRDANSKR